MWSWLNCTDHARCQIIHEKVAIFNFQCNFDYHILAVDYDRSRGNVYDDQKSKRLLFFVSFLIFIKSSVRVYFSTRPASMQSKNYNWSWRPGSRRIYCICNMKFWKINNTTWMLNSLLYSTAHVQRKKRYFFKNFICLRQLLDI